MEWVMKTNEDLFPHLDFNTDKGWGYLPPTDEVLDVFRYVKSECNPERILEIGYYAGHSTSYLAEIMPGTDIISCCPNHPMYRDTVLRVERKYRYVKVIGVKSPEIFEYICDWTFDFAFVDGSHHKKPVMMDVALCLTMGVKWILFDNADQQEVQEGIAPYMHRLEQVKEWQYTGVNKGKTRVNSITLFRVKG